MKPSQRIKEILTGEPPVRTERTNRFCKRNLLLQGRPPRERGEGICRIDAWGRVDERACLNAIVDYLDERTDSRDLISRSQVLQLIEEHFEGLVEIINPEKTKKSIINKIKSL